MAVKSILMRATACALIAACMLGFFTPAASAATQAHTTTACKLYESASTTSKALASVKKGTAVTVIENLGNDWARVIVDKKEGFMQRACIDTGAAGSTADYSIEPGITNKATQLYERADSGARVQASIPRGTSVNVLNSSGDWWRVIYNGTEGFVPAADMRLGTASSSSTSQPSATPAITSTTTPAKNDVNAAKITKAKKTNKDVIGWVNVPNTNVDEPVLYAANFYYADHTIKKKKGYDSTYSYSGSITKNIVIFGHNLRKSAKVFHGLLHLHEAALGYTKCQHSGCKRSLKKSLGNWYKSKAGRTWNISIFGKQKWEVFAMYEVPKNEPIKTLRNNWTLSPANMDTWIKGQISRSDIKFGVSVSSSDQILTLITCGTNYDSATANSRLFVFLKNVG